MNVDDLKFGPDGLIPAVARCVDTGEVLMVAMMSRESLQATLREGRAVYWSRSRQELWRKGDTSGHIQQVREIYADCDGDCLLLQVRQTGPACHTGTRSCFFNKIA